MPTSTYTPQAAIDLCRAFVHKIPVGDVSTQACDIVNSLIWNSHWWRWSFKNITPIALVDGQQDYTPIPTDFYRIVYARVVRTDITPNEFRELTVINYLAPEITRKGGIETLKLIAFDPQDNVFRLDAAASIPSGVTINLQLTYQFQVARITNDKLTTAFVFPDQYFNVFVDGLKWKFYQLSDDPRAGEVRIDREGRKQYSGQLAIFFDSLMQMKNSEDMGEGQQNYFPNDPVGPARATNPGLFNY